MNSFLLNVGLETLPLRVEKHCSNAKRELQEFAEESVRRWNS